RAATLPFGFAALAWFLWRTRILPRGWLCALLAFLGFANGLAPWTVRNVQVFGEPVPVVDSAYYHLWIGNNPHATGGPLTEEAARSARPELAAAPSQPKRFALLGPLVTHEVHHNPAGTLRRRVHATLGFWLGDRFLREGRIADDLGASGWLANAYPAALTGS